LSFPRVVDEVQSHPLPVILKRFSKYTVKIKRRGGGRGRRKEKNHELECPAVPSHFPTALKNQGSKANNLVPATFLQT
jgi:hypothetical protein